MHHQFLHHSHRLSSYTGAPYFSANASAHLGADMSHIICEPTAASVIKTYSPNLMVHPLMRESTTSYPDDPSPPTSESVGKQIDDMLGRLHALVIGPGLGRDKLMQATCAAVISHARRRGIPVVLDADALMLVNNDPDLVRGWKEVVLTPNVVEFSRLAKALGVDEALQANSADPSQACAQVSRALGGVLVLQKGQVDYLSNGTDTWTCDLQGGRKRAGGQGDTLTGSIGTFLCWRAAYLDKLWDVEGDLSPDECVMLAAFGGAAITRECSRLAFLSKGRALQASDVGDQVPAAFANVVGEKEASKL